MMNLKPNVCTFLMEVILHSLLLFFSFFFPTNISTVYFFSMVNNSDICVVYHATKLIQMLSILQYICMLT